MTMPDHTPGHLTVVLPAYQERLSVPMAAQAISQVLKEAGIPFELLFVDDGSGDGTWDAIQDAALLCPARGLRFSRNFGKEAAIFAGLASAEGDCCAVMDCDLQHPPEKLVQMYRLWQQGYFIGRRELERVRPPGDFTPPSAGPPALTCPGPPTSSCWTGGRWTFWWPCGRRTPSSGRCPPGLDFRPPRWSSRSSPGRPAPPNGPWLR